MKKFKRLYVMLVLVLLLVVGACNKAPLIDTQVLDKQYEPATVTTVMMPMVVGKVTMFIPYTIYDDEDFVLNVMGYTVDGDRKCRRIYVSADRYNKVQVGDQVDDLTMQYKDEHREEKQ